MKRVNILFCFLLIYLVGITNVSAECDDRTKLEINTAASNITMDYVIETKVLDNSGNVHEELNPSEVEISEGGQYAIGDFITVKVENISDKVYVVFTNDKDGIIREYHYSDLVNGMFTYELDNTNEVKRFTLTIYSDVNECKDEEINKREIITPKYNPYSDQMICQDNDAFYCKKYITSDVAIPEKDYNNSSRENIGNNIKDKNKINYNFILFTIGIIVVIALIVLIIFLIIKNKRDKEFMEIGGGLK